MIEDPIKGFIYKLIGFLPSEKVTKFSWAGCGDVFVTYENEGKNPSANFYMIAKQQQDTASQPSGPQKKGAAGSIGSNKLQSSEEKYEFKKTGRQEIYERKFDDAWDQSGRYVAVFGIRTSTLDKADKSLRFFNIFGEQLAAFSGLAQFQIYKWRPRPTGILKPKDLQKLKTEYKTKYLKQFKEEEKANKKTTTNVEKEEKKKLREDFFSNFFLPLRKEFEDSAAEYEKLWPIKDKDMAAEEVQIEIIYAYENVLNEVKIK